MPMKAKSFHGYPRSEEITPVKGINSGCVMHATRFNSNKTILSFLVRVSGTKVVVGGGGVSQELVKPYAC